MHEPNQEIQHIRVAELEERGLYEGQYSQDQFYNQDQQLPNQNVELDIYDAYAAQNNRGVMLLREKRYLDAANSFCQAVKYVNERSIYNCPRNEDTQSSNSIEYNNHNDDCYDNHRHSQMTPMLFSEVNTPDFEDSFSTTSSGESSADLGISTSNGINSFYLLLDEETTGDNSSDDSNRNSDRSSLSSPYSIRSEDSYDSSTSRSRDDQTYVFRNPIIVTNGAASRRTSLTHSSTSTSSTSYATDSSRTAASTTTPTPEITTTIDKESCAKLSLVSVYNMALTYHLAALDNGKTSETQEKPKPNGDVRTTSGSDSNAVSSYFPAGPGTCDGAPRAKRRRSIEYNSTTSDLSTFTTITPFGECDTPYQDCNLSRNDNATVKSIINASNSSRIIAANVSSRNDNESNNSTVDRILLAQALAYYQIAYRILVSEQRVLVSQAMVIINNIGHIHRLMGEEDNAKQCFQRLLTTMIYIQQTGDSNQISHWDRFLSNVIDLIIPPENSHKNYAPAA